MDSKTVLKKLENKVQLKKQTLLATAKKLKRRKASHDGWYDPKAIAETKIRESNRLNRRTISGLTYKINSNYFSNARGTCGFSPETKCGHSYGWYSLVQEIKGQVILNDYRYSQQTSIHISRVSEVLRDLGIKYKCLEAPRGLQDLESALKHELQKQAKFIVKEKYARKKSKRWVNRWLRESEKSVQLLISFGLKVTKKMREQAIADAETYRTENNKYLREKRAEKKLMDSLEIVGDGNNKLYSDQGLHIISERGWDWNDNMEFIGKVSDYDRRSAISKGFTKIIVHSKEPRHLPLVSDL